MYNLYRRYIRHIILPDFGLKKQDILLKSSILCIGAGGLGSSALIYLAGSGIGSIGIADFDKVSYDNLNRQILFNKFDIGKKKAICAKRFINKFNPFININLYDYKLSYDNSFDIFSKYDIILDCTDNIESKFLINDICKKLKIPFIHGSVFGSEGYVVTFFNNEFCYRCLYKDLKDLKCFNHGITGFVAGIIGTLQAFLSIKFLLNRNDYFYFNKLFFFDFKNILFNSLDIKNLNKCNFCL